MINLFTQFAASEIHISLAAETLFELGPLKVTNAVLFGVMGIVVMIALLMYAANKIKNGQYNRFVGLVQWAYEGFYNQAVEIIGDVKIARSIFPLAITMFFAVLVTYWISVLPGVGSIFWNDVPVFRGMPADLNFTFALAIITIIASQIYAVKQHGFFGNIGRYIKNPIKDPIGAFEGILEFVGEFSRLVALSFRLFGNAFAGEVLLMVVAVMAGYFAALALPFFFAFEIFIGFIQAYVFFVLTLIFTSLAIQSHGDHGSDNHSPAHSTKEVPAAE